MTQNIAFAFSYLAGPLKSILKQKDLGWFSVTDNDSCLSMTVVAALSRESVLSNLPSAS